MASLGAGQINQLGQGKIPIPNHLIRLPKTGLKI